MGTPCRIDPNAIYDDHSACTTLGLKPDHLARARRSGELRHSRKGSKHFYVGSWLLDWLTADEDRRGGPRHVHD
jgi:hypothetical protein